MPNYQKMYAILCGAIDDVIDPLEKIPLAVPSAKKLRAALGDAGCHIETVIKAGYIWKDSKSGF